VYRFVRRHVLTNTGRFESRAFPGYYAACNGDLLPSFRDKLSLPSSGDKNAKENMGPGRLSRNVGIRNSHYCLRNDTYEGISDLLGGGSMMSDTGCCVLKQNNRRYIERGVSEKSNYVLDWKFYC
jgi:hypothetical protein